MTSIGWIQIALYLRDHRRAHQASRRLHDPRLLGRADASVARAAPCRARALQGLGHRRSPGAELGLLSRLHGATSCRRVPDPLCPAASAGHAAVQPGRAGRRRAGPRLQHVRQLHHQHQLAELRRREHALLPVADAGPDAPEFPLRRHRHRAGGGADPRLRPGLIEDRGVVLGRSHPRHALRAAPDLRRLHALPRLVRHPADARRLLSTRRRSKAPSRPSRSDRWRARSPSRCSAPTAAASSTPMPRTRSRTRRQSATSSRCCRSSPSARRSPTSSAAWWATSARAGPFSAPWACSSSPASRCSTARKPPATRCCMPSASMAATWKARKSASASWPPRSSPPSPRPPRAAPSTPCTTR